MSHKFRLGFGQKYGRYITELDLSDLGYRDAVDPTMVFAALPLLPNVHTVVTPVMDDVDALVANNVERDGGGPRRYGGPEVEFVRDAMYKLCASVPSLVVYLLVGHESIIDGLAKESPQTEQLVLYDHEDADASQLIDVALDALLSCPRLAELQLVMYEELDVHQPLRRFRLPPECNLRCLSLSTFGQCTASLSELVDKLAPVLQSLELEFDQLSPAVADMFAGKVDFPRLETLVIITLGSAEELGDLATSLSPTATRSRRTPRIIGRSTTTWPSTAVTCSSRSSTACATCSTKRSRRTTMSKLHEWHAPCSCASCSGSRGTRSWGGRATSRNDEARESFLARRKDDPVCPCNARSSLVGRSRQSEGSPQDFCVSMKIHRPPLLLLFSDGQSSSCRAASCTEIRILKQDAPDKPNARAARCRRVLMNS